MAPDAQREEEQDEEEEDEDEEDEDVRLVRGPRSLRFSYGASNSVLMTSTYLCTTKRRILSIRTGGGDPVSPRL